MCEVNSIQPYVDSYSNEDFHAQTPSNTHPQRKKNKILQVFKGSSNFIK